MGQVSSADSLRRYARDIGSEPSDFINTLSEATGKAVWLLSEDLEVQWYSDYTATLFCSEEQYNGSQYCEVLPDFKTLLEEMKDSRSSSTRTYIKGGKEYEVVVYPITKEGMAKGYIVTLSNGIRAQLSKFIEKQETRDKTLCSIMLVP